MKALAAAILFMLPIVAKASAPASSSVAAGQKIAFAREMGNCLACHVIAGGEAPGDAGPELKHMKTMVPNRKELYAIIDDEQKRNPQTIMPPFGKNGILTPNQINEVIDFLYTK